ncbi:MAG: hypothetical protein EOP87_00735 [Verrucomicrobiaceae bacterium]|nr:MAG: hypothetical protein EOP87_00735 [Verrucomicrobiaceae bacterium]
MSCSDLRSSPLHRNHLSVKTITLDDAAYERLEALRIHSEESFSDLVKRVVPQAGTLGAMLEFARLSKTADLPGNDILESTVEERSTTKHDPWAASESSYRQG